MTSTTAIMRIAAAFFATPLVVGASSEAEVAISDPSSAPFQAQALEMDDQCLGESCGSAFIQVHGSALRGDHEQQDAGFQRKTAKVPPPTDEETHVWLQKVHPGPWGDVIDAGTGPDSLTWLASCPVRSITAVTANETARSLAWTMTKQYLDPALDSVVAGNWKNPDFMRGKQFDTVVADWLLGSVEFFAPHYQVGLVRRLKQLVKPGGWIMINGREPDNLKTNGTGNQLMLEIDALRDAATVLGQRHPYRELPQWWVEEELGAVGFKALKSNSAPLHLSPDYVQSQLDWAHREIKTVEDDTLRTALETRHQALLSQAKETTSAWDNEEYSRIYSIIANLAA